MAEINGKEHQAHVYEVKDGWKADCDCGWRTLVMSTRKRATVTAHDHIFAQYHFGGAA